MVESPISVENMAERSTELKTQTNQKTLTWATPLALDSSEGFRGHRHPKAQIKAITNIYTWEKLAILIPLPDI